MAKNQKANFGWNEAIQQLSSDMSPALKQADVSGSLPQSAADYMLLVWIKGYWKQFMRGSYDRCKAEADRITLPETQMMIVDVVWRQ